MTTTAHISATTAQASAGNAQSQAAQGSASGLMGFLNLLMGETGGAQDAQGLTANIAALVKNNPGDTASLSAMLQKLYPNANAAEIQKAVAQLSAGAVKPALTSDLSASAASSLQNDTGVMSELQQKFDAMAEHGPVTPAKMAQFRRDAINVMKSKGFSSDQINQALVNFSADQGDKLSVSLAAQLAMPVPAATTAQATMSNNAGSGSDDSSDDTIQGLPAQSPAAGGPAPASAPGDDTDAADAADAAGAAGAQPGLPAQASGIPAAAPQQAGVQADDDAPEAAPAAAAKGAAKDADADEASGAPAKPASAAAHFFVMNNAQGGDAFGDANSGGQQADGAGQVTVTGAAQDASASSGQSFVNYMSQAPASTSAATAPATTVQNVAVQIQQSAQQGLTTFTMQLEPAELGRLEVRLKFDRDGSVKARLIADKPETLSMLKNDENQLQRLLQQTGLDAGKNALTFDLRQQNDQQQNSGNAQGSYQPAASGDDKADAAGAVQANIAVRSEGYISQGGVNITV